MARQLPASCQDHLTFAWHCLMTLAQMVMRAVIAFAPPRTSHLSMAQHSRYSRFAPDSERDVFF